MRWALALGSGILALSVDVSSAWAIMLATVGVLVGTGAAIQSLVSKLRRKNEGQYMVLILELLKTSREEVKQLREECMSLKLQIGTLGTQLHTTNELLATLQDRFERQFAD